MKSSCSSSSTRAFKFAVLMVLAILLIQCSSVSHGALPFLPKKTTVAVRNDISANTILTIHCKSKDDDLGEQKLSYKQYFSWRFRPNYWDTTVFWCNFWWYDSNGHLVQGGYQVYKSKRDQYECFQQCLRSARPDGLYLNFGPDFRKMYDWPKS
ncbi:Plant self-incompatibility S1 [Macleaya cordata]|uniref:S-protein homolog n=1 Tax=Macleaya cordata TaxID=56857 RepID=A0A200R423_MACCD|nr:Plant self-incompatibility S1 [Macleaya cordata]